MGICNCRQLSLSSSPSSDSTNTTNGNNEILETLEFLHKQGDPIGTYKLAQCYLYGVYVSQDVTFGCELLDSLIRSNQKKAIQSYLLSHQQGNIEATFELGCYYLTGTKDNSICTNFYLPLDRTELSLLAQEGLSSRTDNKSNYFKNNISNYNNSNSISLNLNKTFKKYQNEWVTVNHHEAVKLFKMCESVGHVKGTVKLGLCYSNGFGNDILLISVAIIIPSFLFFLCHAHHITKIKKISTL